MPGSQRKAQASRVVNRPRAAAPRRRAIPAGPTADQVHDLAWSGEHHRAIELATRALAVARLGVADRIGLLELRAESLIAMGDLDSASTDAASMLAAARRVGKPALLAQSLNCRALIEIRTGASRPALVTAADALAAARRSKRPDLEALSLYRLAEAQFRQRTNEEAAKTATQAIRAYRKLRNPLGEGRAWWALSAARSSQGRADEANRAASQALTLARRSGDLFGLGNATNMLTFNEPDIAVALRLLRRSLAAFEAAGYVERQGIITHNLGNAYSDLGLRRRARRLFLQASATYRRTGALGSLTVTLWVLSWLELEEGHLEAASVFRDEALALAENAQDERYRSYRPFILGAFALETRDCAQAIRYLDEADSILRQLDAVALHINVLTMLGRACLLAHDKEAALAATRRATALHRAHGLAGLEGMHPEETWWLHSQALAASGRKEAARRALATAYRYLVKPIASLSDEGLRRNYLNKSRVRREIVTAWLAGNRKRKSVPAASRISPASPTCASHSSAWSTPDCA